MGEYLLTICRQAHHGGYSSPASVETHKVMLEHYSQMKNIFINLKDGVSGMYDIK